MTEMLAGGWIWLIAAVLLAALEVLLPGYVLLGFAIGAATVGLLLLVGGPLAWLAGSLPMLVLIFGLVSVAAWLALRRWLSGRRPTVRTFDEDINDD